MAVWSIWYWWLNCYRRVGDLKIDAVNCCSQARKSSYVFSFRNGIFCDAWRSGEFSVAVWQVELREIFHSSLLISFLCLCPLVPLYLHNRPLFPLLLYSSSFLTKTLFLLCLWRWAFSKGHRLCNRRISFFWRVLMASFGFTEGVFSVVSFSTGVQRWWDYPLIDLLAVYARWLNQPILPSLLRSRHMTAHTVNSLSFRKTFPTPMLRVRSMLGFWMCIRSGKFFDWIGARAGISSRAWRGVETTLVETLPNIHEDSISVAFVEYTSWLHAQCVYFSPVHFGLTDSFSFVATIRY